MQFKFCSMYYFNHFFILFRNTVRKTQSAALTSTSGGGNDTIFLGEKDKDFQFQQLSKFKVTLSVGFMFNLKSQSTFYPMDGFNNI